MGSIFSQRQEKRKEEEYSISDFFQDDLTWNVELLEQIISKGVKLNEPLKLGTRPLHAAARRGDLNVVQTLLSHGAKVDVRDQNKETALHLAAQGGHYETVKLLLDAGADISAKNCSGDTPLHKTNCFAVAEALISNGASVTEKNNLKLTPLHSLHIFPSEKSLKDITELLIEHGADINSLDSNGRTALHYAARNSRPDTLSVLITKGALPDVKDSDGWTPMFHAVDCDMRDNVECLLDFRASLDVKLKSRYTCVHLAARKQSAQSMLVLAQKGAKLNVQDKHGCTPLHYAVAWDSSEVVVCLLAHGASVSVKNHRGITPFQIANRQHRSKKLVAMHILLSQLAGLPETEELNAELTEEKTQEAVKELDRMRTTKMAEEFCLKDIFASCKRPKYLLDDNLLESIETLLQSTDFQDQFPIYANILKVTFTKSKKGRYYLARRATISMMNVNRIICCQLTPDLVWEKITGYLSLEDLTNIIKSEV